MFLDHWTEGVFGSILKLKNYLATGIHSKSIIPVFLVSPIPFPFVLSFFSLQITILHVSSVITILVVDVRIILIPFWFSIFIVPADVWVLQIISIWKAWFLPLVIGILFWIINNKFRICHEKFHKIFSFLIFILFFGSALVWFLFLFALLHFSLFFILYLFVFMCVK